MGVPVNDDSAADVLDLARNEGVPCDHLVPLRSTNNEVFLLSGCSVVAKVHTSGDAATRELAAGIALADLDAPTVRPAAGIGGKVHDAGGRHVTFWDLVAGRDSNRLPSRAIADGLGTLHGHLVRIADIAGDRSFVEQVSDTMGALHDPSFAPQLDRSDRDLLRDRLARTLSDLQDASPAVVHGAPHRGNIVGNDGAAVFVDLETVGLGPIEWDLAHLEVEVAREYPLPHDEHVLAACRLAVSATTAAWCWDALERGPDMRAHAQHHLSIVRAAS